jgi:C-terminal processing protease CtpA/Prc
MQRATLRTLIWFILALLVGCLGALAYGWTRLRQAEQEVSRLRPLAETVSRLQEENRALETLRVDADELERLRKQTQEIHKLRGQYQELQRVREQQAALERENEQLKAANQQLNAQHQSLRGQFQSAVATRANPTPAQAVPNPPTWLGVAIQSLAENAQVKSQATGITDGVIVTSVVPNGPAEGVGLQAGDIIVALDGNPMSSAPQLREAMRTKQIGQRVVLDVYREGLIHKIGINTAPYPTE